MQIKIDDKVIYDDDLYNLSDVEKNKDRQLQLIKLVQEKLESTLRDFYNTMRKIRMSISHIPITNFYNKLNYRNDDIISYRIKSKHSDRYIYVTNNRIRYFDGYGRDAKEIEFCEETFDMKSSGCMSLDIVLQEIENLQNNKNKILEDFTKHIVNEVTKYDQEISKEETRLDDIEKRLNNLK